MGEGQGAKDVSDKIENEDQLLGAQQKGEEEQQVRILTILSLYLLVYTAHTAAAEWRCCSRSSSCVLHIAAIRVLPHGFDSKQWMSSFCVLQVRNQTACYTYNTEAAP